MSRKPRAITPEPAIPSYTACNSEGRGGCLLVRGVFSASIDWKHDGILSTKMITGVLDLFMKPESPLVVIQASRMKENEHLGLESDS
ncbi:hypothetical protein GBA52_015327 [Prunus armeniaca]|nr:hypothetical protein GBA52_015327 [Prunus armeniaca]